MQSKLVTILLFFAASLNIFVSSCSDRTVNDGEPWYSSIGPSYNCAWYEYFSTTCGIIGNSYENFGLVAIEACCACGGGLRNPTTSPSPTSSPSLHPTSSPTASPTYIQWTPVASKGTFYDADGNVDANQFRTIWASSPNQILHRKCRDCVSSHQDIYYRRFDGVGGLPSNLDLLDTVKNNWFDSPNNTFNVDFKLYSSYDDALNDINAWTFCNFDDPGVGFPRDCGPTGEVTSQWNSFVNWGGQLNVGFYVETPTTGPACSDLTVNNGESWYSSIGYNCAWYGENDCTLSDLSEKFGLVASVACCACGGGTTRITSSPTYWPTSSPWNRNNYDNGVGQTTVVVAVLGAFFGMFVIIGIWAKIYSNNNAPRSTNLRTRPTQRTPQQTQHAASSIVNERDVRRQFILRNIIHKKVVTKSSQTNGDTQDDIRETAIAGISQDNSTSNEIDDDGEVIFPHEAIIRERSERIASLRLSLNDHDVGDEEQGGEAIHDKKDDICIETLRSIRSGMNLHLDLESLDESLYSPRSCPICCEDYAKGDDVAWSKNEECCHAFHTDCIVPWLMDHDDCPMCRCVHVKEGAQDRADC